MIPRCVKERRVNIKSIPEDEKAKVWFPLFLSFHIYSGFSGAQYLSLSKPVEIMSKETETLYKMTKVCKRYLNSLTLNWIGKVFFLYHEMSTSFVRIFN